jgi:hypothetical protein
LRCRKALDTWCDPYGRFPGVVEDPNYYCPPFAKNNPYLGWECRSADPKDYPDEGRFLQYRSLVEVSQLLVLIVLNFKLERSHPCKVPYRQRAASVVIEPGPSKVQATPFEKLVTPRRRPATPEKPETTISVPRAGSTLSTTPRKRSMLKKRSDREINKGDRGKQKKIHVEAVADMPLDLLPTSLSGSGASPPSAGRGNAEPPHDASSSFSSSPRGTGNGSVSGSGLFGASRKALGFMFEGIPEAEETGLEDTLASTLQRRASMAADLFRGQSQNRLGKVNSAAWFADKSGKDAGFQGEASPEGSSSPGVREMEAELHRLVGSFVKKYS